MTLGIPVPEPSARLEAFLTWISKSPSHLDAARDAVEASRCLRQIDRLRAIEAEALVNRVHNSLSARARYGDAPFDSTLKSAGRPRRPWAIPIALLTLLLVPLHLPTIGALPVSYRADVGQHTFVPLADNSTVELNTRTQIEVLYGPHSREITLLSGEAVFDVRHDAAHPFRVLSANTIIEDVGTKFVVYRHTDDTTTVTVLAGRVSVGSMAGTQNLQAGQTVTVGGRNRAIHAVSLSPPEIARRLSWRAGVLSFQGETLAEAIAEINRYNKRRLVIEDPVIADWQLGGMFQARDLDAFIATLEHAFSLRAERTPNGARVIVLRRR